MTGCIDKIDTLRTIVIMWVARKPEPDDWEILLRLIRTLSIEIGEPKLLRVAQTQDNLALYQIADILGIDDEEKEIIFEKLFQDED